MDTLARPLMYANFACIWIYIVLWQGAERFFVESFGTLILSPVIYMRISPDFIRAPLTRALTYHPMLGHLLCAIPVAIFFVAIGFGIVAYRRRSFPVALLACLMVSTIFVVYHSVKHLGISLVYY